MTRLSSLTASRCLNLSVFMLPVTVYVSVLNVKVGLSTGPALAPGERALWASLADGGRGGLHGGPERTHHDVYSEWRSAAG